MPFDKPEATATATPRRTFLARAAVGSALVTAGSIAGPLLRAAPAGAQASGEAGALTDEEYAAWVTPLELAAVQIYSSALAVDGLSEDVTTALSQFQSNHQTVADTVGALYSGDAPLDEDPSLLATASNIGGDEAAVLASLVQLENNLAATHMSALADLADVITAKTAAQILAVEGQQAVALAKLAGTDVEAAVPDVATTDGALRPQPGGGSTTTTTTEADGTTTTVAGDTTTTTEEAGNR